MADTFRCQHCLHVIGKAYRSEHTTPCQMPAPTAGKPTGRCGSQAHASCTHIKETAS